MVSYTKRMQWSDRLFVIFVLLMTVIVACAFLYLFTRPAHAESLPAPITIVPPNSLPTYAHPSPSPSGPMTILPPASLPIYVHPSPSPSGPATVIVPGALPTYVYPGGVR